MIDEGLDELEKVIPALIVAALRQTEEAARRAGPCSRSKAIPWSESSRTAEGSF